MRNPTTYAEWVMLLDRFGDGDNAVLDLLDKGSFEIDSGAADRFFLIIETVYSKRKKIWLEDFRKILQVQAIRTEGELEIILHQAKQKLLPLVRFVHARGIPEKIRDFLYTDLEDFNAEIKKSLKESASKIGDAKEMTFLVINNFNLPRINNTPLSETNQSDESVLSKNSPRKIIF